MPAGAWPRVPRKNGLLEDARLRGVPGCEECRAVEERLAAEANPAAGECPAARASADLLQAVGSGRRGGGRCGRRLIASKPNFPAAAQLRGRPQSAPERCRPGPVPTSPRVQQVLLIQGVGGETGLAKRGVCAGRRDYFHPPGADIQRVQSRSTRGPW